MPFAKIRGQNIHYVDSGGSGPVVLLSHGFLMDHRMFSHQVDALGPDFRVVAWDERGFGKTEFDGQPFTYWDSADDALALLDHLHIDRAIFGGMSQGGFLSMRAALRAPERVAGLILISTQAGTDGPEILVGYRQMLETWASVGPVQPLLESIATIILGTDRAHWEPWMTDWRARPNDALIHPAGCLLDRDDITSRVAEIRCPAIVFHGTADQAISMSRAEQLASLLPDCRGMVKVEGAAHAANLTHPEQVNPAFVDFCKALAPSLKSS
ncbi:MAG: alpha/beta hydrolase [Polyangiaceae bacterium]